MPSGQDLRDRDDGARDDGARATGAGLGFAVLSAAAFGLSGPLAKALFESGWSSGAAVSVRIMGAAVVLLPPALMALRGRWYLVRQNAGLILAYGAIAIAACQLFYFNAVTSLSVGVALLLEYLGPVLVVAWLWACHGQRPRRLTVLGIVLSIGGLVLILDVTGGMRVDLVGVLWALGAACGLAFYFVLSGRRATGLPPLVMAAGGMVVASVILLAAGVAGLLPITATAQDVVLAGMTMPWLAPVLGLCLLAAALAYATGIAATRRLGAKLASFVGLAEVMFTLAFAWLLVGDVPLGIQFVGGALIVAGVLSVRYDELVADRPVRGALSSAAGRRPARSWLRP